MLLLSKGIVYTLISLWRYKCHWTPYEPNTWRTQCSHWYTQHIKNSALLLITFHTNHSTHSLDNARNTKAASSWTQKILTLIELYRCPQLENQGKLMMHLSKKVAAKMRYRLIKKGITIYFMVLCTLSKFWSTEEKLNNFSFCLYAFRTVPSKITDRRAIGTAGISTN